ncbi:MAG TPA: sulfite exporter TauE/SafE family protein [Frankiaceae bacterium]
MDALGGVAVAAAGLFAGTINTVVGSGSLVTFPVLLGVGYSPLVANVSNTVGLVPGSVSGAIGYRRELVGQRGRAVRLGACSLLGGLTGGLLLLGFPNAFRSIVPWLVIAAALLMAAQPRLSALLRARAERRTPAAAVPAGAPAAAGAPTAPVTRPDSRIVLPVLVFATGVYGGYFGAAQGVVLLALLGILADDGLQRLNALKNVLAGVVNGVAAVLFILVSHVSWPAALLIGAGALVGGQVGAVVARRIPPAVLRAVISVGGVVVGVVLLVRG